jgi:large subunit ribosomal protein L15
MQIHQLKRKTENKKKKTVGRGGRRGKTSGRGTKGQNARAGRKKRPELRDIIKKIPKIRGRGKNLNTSIQTKPVVVNLNKVAAAYKAGDEVNPQTLLTHGLIEKSKGNMPKVKILGDGELDKALVFTGCVCSASAKEKIEKAGGKIS